MQAVSYFLDVTRMANPCYFHRLLDIIRSELGAPLLRQLSLATDKLCGLLSTIPDQTNQQVCSSSQVLCVAVWSKVPMRFR